jgi:hypothetical protein
MRVPGDEGSGNVQSSAGGAVGRGAGWASMGGGGDTAVADGETVLISGHERRAERPEPEWVRAQCPCCGEDVVSNAYYVGGKGYLIVWECWNSQAGGSACDYRHVL